MDDCSKLCELLSAYCDGELDPEEEQLALDHLAECQKCCRMLDQQKAIKEIAAKLPRAKASEALRLRVRRELDRCDREGPVTRARNRLSYPPFPVLILSLAVFFFLAAIGSFLCWNLSGTWDGVAVNEELARHLEECVHCQAERDSLALLRIKQEGTVTQADIDSLFASLNKWQELFEDYERAAFGPRHAKGSTSSGSRGSVVPVSSGR